MWSRHTLLLLVPWCRTRRGASGALLEEFAPLTIGYHTSFRDLVPKSMVADGELELGGKKTMSEEDRKSVAAEMQGKYCRGRDGDDSVLIG